MTFQSALPISILSSASTVDPSNAHGKLMTWLTPDKMGSSKPASATQPGKSMQGLEHRKVFSRLIDSRSSIHALSNGPAVLRTGAASMILISSNPPGASKRWHSRNSCGSFDDGTNEGSVEARIRENVASGHGHGIRPGCDTVVYDTFPGKGIGR